MIITLLSNHKCFYEDIKMVFDWSYDHGYFFANHTFLVFIHVYIAQLQLDTRTNNHR